MRRTLKAAIALLTVSTLSLLASSPALAIKPTELAYTFNCGTLSPNQTISFPMQEGVPVSVELIDCDGAFASDDNNSGEVSTEDGTVTNTYDFAINDASETMTFNDVALVVLYSTAGDDTSEFIALETILPPLLVNPVGTELISSTATIPDVPDAFTITEGVTDDDGDILLDGNETCDLESGTHPYTTKLFHVTKTGKYTFRLLGSDPIVYDVDNRQEFSAMDDPMVAMYEGAFDPNDANANVAGCNDDLNDYSDLYGYDWTDNDGSIGITEDGDLISDRFSYFEATLEPGYYTFVFTVFDDVPVEEWTSDTGSATYDYDVWGPTSGIVEVDELAATGVNAEFGIWAGLGLLVTGAVIAVARRRAVARL